MVPATALAEDIGAGPTLLYAGPGSKKGAYGKMPLKEVLGHCVKENAETARITVLPPPVTSQTALTRGAKLALAGA